MDALLTDTPVKPLRHLVDPVTEGPAQWLSPSLPVPEGLPVSGELVITIATKTTWIVFSISSNLHGPIPRRHQTSSGSLGYSLQKVNVCKYPPIGRMEILSIDGLCL